MKDACGLQGEKHTDGGQAADEEHQSHESAHDGNDDEVVRNARSEDRLPDSHLGRTNIKENGVGLKIVRRSLPFGQVSGEHGLQFIAYSASLHNIDEQLKFMFGEKDDKIDLLLKHMSTAKRSAYYYAPSVERLVGL